MPPRKSKRGGSDQRSDGDSNVRKRSHHRRRRKQKMVPKTDRDVDAGEEEEEEEDDDMGIPVQYLIPKFSGKNTSASSSPKNVQNGSQDFDQLLFKNATTAAGGGGKKRNLEKHIPEESSLTIFLQVFFPFLVAGFGMVGAGLVLDIVQHWPVFREISEVFILVPALLGLKGNIEMTLASRLSTQANLGNLDKKSEQWSMIVANVGLIQCQASVVGFLASIAAMIMGWVPEGKFNLDHALLLCASSILTATIASLILGCIMIGVILLSRKCNINPDNVATPIAASLGDLTTLALLSGITSLLYDAIGNQTWLAPLIIASCLLMTPMWAYLAKRSKYTVDILYTGWTPVISAMGISSLGGVILDFTVSSFKGIAVFQPVINGVGGNLVAVQASRISTALHREAHLGILPASHLNFCFNPCSTFFGFKVKHAKTARVLMLLVIPGHMIFAFAISYLKAGHTSLTPLFACAYLTAAIIQVFLLLYIAHMMIHWMWTKEIDPDNSAIPYLTAIGDLLGTGLLAIAFEFLYLIGDQDSDVGD